MVEFWDVCCKCLGVMFVLGDVKFNEDIVVLLCSYEKFVVFLDKLCCSLWLLILIFGYFGDGNLYVNIMYYKDNYVEYLWVEKVVGEFMKGVVVFGGVILGEYGIGLVKLLFLWF